MRECQDWNFCRLIDRFFTIVLLLFLTDFFSQKSGQTVLVILTNLRFSKHSQNEVLVFSGMTENEEDLFRREDVTLGFGGLCSNSNAGIFVLSK